MAERNLRVCQDTQLAMMGHIVLNNYGEGALDALVKWNHENTKKKWHNIAESTGRNDPEYLFCLFENARKNNTHEFEVIEKNRNVLEVKVTKCVHADVFQKLNATKIGKKLRCYGDVAITEGFNPSIKFTRPKLLMTGDNCCHFKWELE